MSDERADRMSHWASIAEDRRRHQGHGTARTSRRDTRCAPTMSVLAVAQVAHHLGGTKHVRVMRTRCADDQARCRRTPVAALRRAR